MKRILMAAAFVVPMKSKQDWKLLEFGSIPANKVTFAKEAMSINVDKSASPIIYPLKKGFLLKEVVVTGKIEGKIPLKAGQVQGEKAFDDYLFRLGLVIKGEKTLNFAKRLIAPKWIKTLFDIAPDGSGVDHIYFLNLGSDPKHLGRVRQHPLSELMKEEVVAVREGNDFVIHKSFKKPVEIIGLWISSDGDNTGAKFVTQLSQIKLLDPAAAAMKLSETKESGEKPKKEMAKMAVANKAGAKKSMDDKNIKAKK